MIIYWMQGVRGDVADGRVADLQRLLPAGAADVDRAEHTGATHRGDAILPARLAAWVDDRRRTGRAPCAMRPNASCLVAVAKNLSNTSRGSTWAVAAHFPMISTVQRAGGMAHRG